VARRLRRRPRSKDRTLSAPAISPEAGFSATIDDQLVTITLNRPERLNSQSPHTWNALTQLASELPGTVRVAVLRGAGRAFSAGLDRDMFSPEGIPGVPSLLDLAKGTEADASTQIGEWQKACDWSSRPSLVSIAAVQGHAIGAGFQLALGTDIRIVADDVQFSMAEPTLGLVPDLGGTKRLVDLIGPSRAMEIVLTGRRVGAEEALRIGLASAVVPREELDAAVDRTVQALLAVDRGASAETKSLLQQASGRTQDEQQTAEREAQYRRMRALAGLD
jgi:enoyl-CoA hydratase/carnithine racemase